ncbi:MAG TPA: hypothetical protein PKD00_10580, partial [Burkholderiales bacterium]|nr:hypothetical protein [Burkholderiales bacterium]
MTLKYIDINGRGVLVDESAEIKEEICIRYVQDIPYVMKYDKGIDHKQYPIICAEKELNLDVPILPNWREWEVKQLAIKDLENYFGSNLELNEKGKLWVEG